MTFVPKISVSAVFVQRGVGKTFPHTLIIDIELVVSHILVLQEYWFLIERKILLRKQNTS